MNWLIVRIRALRITNHVVTNLLLLGILLVLARISWRMPPTYRDFMDATQAGKDGTEYMKVVERQPLIHVPNTVDVRLQNSSIDVRVDNEPIDVRIER